ncbi:MAG: hypothetical protein ABI899_10795, partial [Actinomycetota bacterium]
GLAGPRWQLAAAAIGSVAATAFWVLGQNGGELYSGQATDPNTGPLLVLMALALAGISAQQSRTGTTVHVASAPIRDHQRRRTTDNRDFTDKDGWKNIMDRRNGTRKGTVGLLIAVPLLLTGCAAASASAGDATPTTSMSPGESMSPGMSMAPGESMAGMTATSPVPAARSNVTASRPSASAAMICGPETVKNVTTLMGMRTPAPATATWADHLYTCTYRLPGGPLVLSVKESSNATTARSYFDMLRARLGKTVPVTGLAGLGLPAYEKDNGTVVFLKDNMTLQVNATALPPRVGPQNTSPADLAYTVATDILACWSGN